MIGALSAALVLAVLATLPPPSSAVARPLEDIRRRGVIELCAHPDALPFAKRRGPVRGLQVELAERIARGLGVDLAVDWVVTRWQIRYADCDLVMDVIVDREALAAAEPRLRVSRPYFRSGVVLAVPPEHAGRGLEALPRTLRVGVLIGSLAHRRLERAGFVTVPFGFEDEMMEAVAAGEIDAAAVTPITLGWFRHHRPDLDLAVLDPFAGDDELSWNLAVGMRRSDRFLRRAVDDILEDLLVSGELAALYARYGIDFRPPHFRAPRRVGRRSDLGTRECVRLGYARACRR